MKRISTRLLKTRILREAGMKGASDCKSIHGIACMAIELASERGECDPLTDTRDLRVFKRIDGTDSRIIIDLPTGWNE